MLKADNISAPNQVTVTFPKAAEGEEVTAEDLAKTTITLTDEEGNELTATFKDLTKDGQAIYEVEEDLVDAKKYTPTSEDLALPADPVIAKVAEEFVAEFTTDTKFVSDKSNTIQLNLLNQYGDPAKVEAETVTVTGTLNGMPLTDGENGEITFKKETNVVTVNKKLVAGNKLVFTVQNVKTEKDKEPVILASNDFEFTIAEGEAPAPSKIVGITATKKVEAEEVTADEVLPKDVVTLTADLRDQYNNKVAGNETEDLIRWVVTEGKDVVTLGEVTKEQKEPVSTLDTKGLTVDYTALKAGKATITAFNIANGAKYEYKVEVGATPLENVKATPDLKDLEGETLEQQYNKEEAQIGTVKADTSGAILTPDMIDFEVTPGEGLTKDDIKVVAEYAKDQDGKETEEIIVKATTTKAGTYKVKPVVKAADKEVKVEGDFTVTTTINPNVAEISKIEFDEKELKSNATITKPIVLKNKHGEVLTMEDFTGNMKQYVSLTSNNEGVIKSEGIQIVGGDTEETKNDTHLTFKVGENAKGVTILTVQSKADTKVFQTYALEFTAPVLTTIDAGKDVKGVVAGDGKDKAVYNELKFLDQDGLETAKPDGATVIVTDSANKEVKNEQDATGKELAEIVEGEFTDEGKFENKKGTGKYFVKVQPGKDLKGTYTVTVTNGEEKDAKEYVADSFKVEVNEARKAAKFVVKPTATTIAKGASADFLIELQDQYDEAFNLPEGKEIEVNEKDTDSEEAMITLDDNVTPVQKDNEKVTGLYTFTAKVNELADAKDYTLVVTVPTAEDQDPITKEITVKVDAGSNLAKSLEITGENIENGKAVLPIQVKEGKLVNNKDTDYKLGLNVLDEAGEKINYLDNDVEWSSKTEGVTIEEGIIKVEDTVFEDKKDTATITLNAKYFGIDQDIELEVSKAERAIQEGTLQATQKVEDEVSTVVSVEIDKDATDGQIEVTYTGTDQFGKEYEALNDRLSVKSFDTSVATVAQPAEGKVVITAVKEGKTQIEATIDNVTHMLDVIVTKEAADQAAVAEAVKTLEEKAENFKTLEVNDATDEDQKKQAVKAEAEKHVTDGVTVTKVEKASETRTADAADEDEATVNTETYLVTLEKNKASKVVEVEAAFGLTEKAKNEKTVGEALAKVENSYELADANQLKETIKAAITDFEGVQVEVEVLEDNEENTHKVTLTAGEDADQATETKDVKVTEIFTADSAVLKVETDEKETEKAVAAKATIGDVEFEAVQAGADGNNIEIEIKQGEASSAENPVETSVAVESNKVTITLGATWDEDTSTPKSVTVQELVTLINGEDSPVKDLIQASFSGDKENEVVQVTDSAVSLTGGSAATTETVTTSKTLEVTFSEAVKLEGNFVLTLKDGKTATVAEGADAVTATNQVVTIKLDVDSTIEADDTIDSIEGVTVEGKKLKLENLTVTADE